MAKNTRCALCNGLGFIIAMAIALVLAAAFNQFGLLR